MPPSTPRRAAALLGAAALGLALAGCGGDEQAATAPPAAPLTASAPASPTAAAPAEPAEPAADTAADTVDVAVTVAGGQVSAPSDRVEVPLGSTVRLTVTSDAADEAHVHGYDHTLDLAPGEPATVEFVADIPGVFEVELHDAGDLLVNLQVS